MKYIKFFDLLASAYSAHLNRDASAASRYVSAALRSPDAAIAVNAMLAHNEDASFRRRVSAASDIGVEIDETGEDLRVEPYNENGADPDDLNPPITARRLQAAARRVQASAGGRRVVALTLKNFKTKDGKDTDYNSAHQFDDKGAQRMLRADENVMAVPEPDGSFLLAEVPAHAQMRMDYFDASGEKSTGSPTPMSWNEAKEVATGMTIAGNPMISWVNDGFAVGVFRGGASTEKKVQSRAIRSAKDAYFASLRG